MQYDQRKAWTIRIWRVCRWWRAWCWSGIFQPRDIWITQLSSSKGIRHNGEQSTIQATNGYIFQFSTEDETFSTKVVRRINLNERCSRKKSICFFYLDFPRLSYLIVWSLWLCGRTELCPKRSSSAIDDFLPVFSFRFDFFRDDCLELIYSLFQMHNADSKMKFLLFNLRYNETFSHRNFHRLSIINWVLADWLVWN